MAHFCARVRKRDDLPPVSMKDIYGHPTIRSLATALTDVPEAAPPRHCRRTPAAGQHRPYVLCGICSSSSSPCTACSGTGIAWGTHGYPAATASAVYLRSWSSAARCSWPSAPSRGGEVGAGGPVEADEFPVWGPAYLRFWTVKALLHANPMSLFTGNPLYVLYLRALGARIGKGVTILSPSVPVCTDLLTVGAGTVIRKDSLFLGYRAYAGRIRTGRVTLGKDVFVGEKTVLDIGTSMGDGRELGHSSALHGVAAVPAGQRWHGSPAQRTEVDYVPGRARRLRHICAGRATRLATALQLLFVYMPLTVGGGYLLAALAPSLEALVDPDAPILASARFYARRWPCPSRPSSASSWPVWRRAGRPPRAQPGDRAGQGLSAVRRALLGAAGDRADDQHQVLQVAVRRQLLHRPLPAGHRYDLSQVEQTGSNFGTEV